MNYLGFSVVLLALIVPMCILLARTVFQSPYARLGQRMGKLLDLLSTHRSLMAIGSGVLVMLLRASLLPVWPMPVPLVLDEFSYLLMGETFASGRLANPPHPMWQHLETPFVLQQPAYASVYPVIQGLYLALGQRVAGHAWWGVWLSVGIMCAVTCWALQGWLPPRWALLGTLWICVQLSLSTYWMNSYWGGAASATGGALIIGAAGRMRTRLNIRYALLLATGLAILANTRPYEGLLLATVIIGWLGARMLRKRVRLAALVTKLVVPMVAVLGLTASLMSGYFSRVTGSALKVPYQTYFEQYAATPLFVWQKPPRAPEYRHDVLRKIHLAFLDDYHRYDTVGGALLFSLEKLRLLGGFYLGPLVFVPLIVLPCLFRGRLRVLLVATVATLAGILCILPVQPHYGAPLTAALVILAMQALRLLWIARRYGNPIGEFLVPGAFVVCVVYAISSAASTPPPAVLRLRPKLIGWLQEHGSRHLIIVRYRKDHPLSEEWVYNSADIDHSAVVWARDMGAQRNMELLRYYPDRKPWLFLADENPAQLSPYVVSTAP